MEFKLNKIDTDIRLKMQEEIRADKVTKNDNVIVKRDTAKEKSERNYTKKKMKKSNKFFQVECVKYFDKEIEVQGEKVQITNEENQKGQRIDAKK